MCSRRVACGQVGRSGPAGLLGTSRDLSGLVGGSRYRLATVRSHVLLIEHVSEYVSNTRANDLGPEGEKMTILDTREIQAAPVVRPGIRPVHARRRPPSRRPGGAPMRHRGSGVRMSRT